MLTALIRKDIRICRLPIMAGIIFLLGPFLMAAVMVCNMPLWTEATPASAWAVLLGTGGYFSVMISQATLAMISGNLIAAERADRSAEFLACLPPSRKRILGSKFVVLGGAVLIVWGFNLIVGLFAEWLAPGTEGARTITSDLVPLRYYAAIGFVAMAAGWAASAISNTSEPPVAIAFAAPLVVLSVLKASQYVTQWPTALDFSRVYVASCVVFSVLLFASGTAYFLHRIEP